MILCPWRPGCCRPCRPLEQQNERANTHRHAPTNTTRNPPPVCFLTLNRVELQTHTHKRHSGTKRALSCLRSQVAEGKEIWNLIWSNPPLVPHLSWTGPRAFERCTDGFCASLGDVHPLEGRVLVPGVHQLHLWDQGHRKSRCKTAQTDALNSTPCEISASEPHKREAEGRRPL